MRSLLAGLFTLLILTPAALAQVTGFVESVGLGGSGAGGGGIIRPDHWTPMRVNLSSQVSTPESYQLQVWQDDLDSDRVVYTKDITLSPQSQEKFDTYFVFQPSEELKSNQPISSTTLRRILHVRLCQPPAEGKRPDEAKVVIDRLDIKFSVSNIDPAGSHLGTRLVLCITDGNSRSGLETYRMAVGLAEDVEPVMLHPADLGENVLFYDSVDTVIWLGGNADELSTAGSKRREALEQYVREGGRLIIAQPAATDMHKIEPLAGLLPIELKDSHGGWLVDFPKDDSKKTLVDENSADPKAPKMDALVWLARDEGRNHYPSKWHEINSDGKYPIHIAHAQKLKPDAVVAFWQNWSDTERWPYVVRGAHGLGCVTWVAQDLGDPNLHAAGSDNWPHIWDYVIGWRNNTYTLADAQGNTDRFNDQKKQRENLDSIGTNRGGLVDFSEWLLQRMAHEGRGAAYIFVAVLFFIAYWLVAGPGTYVILSKKKRKELNWFMFGLWAFVGTALTVGVVRLLLHGGAEAKHLTLVRQSLGEPAEIYSRVGLYIPRDGEQTISLENTAHDAISYITPLQIHPQYNDPTNFPAAQVYAIPIHDDPQPVNVRIPYRSTLKKLQARWVGAMKDGVTVGAPVKLIPSNGDNGVITGTVKNETGTDLRNVYFAFRFTMDGTQEDRVLFVRKWGNGKDLALNDEYQAAAFIGGDSSSKNTPRDDKSAPIKGDMLSWSRYWTGTGLWGTEGMGTSDKRGEADFYLGGTGVSNAFPILSLFDRIMPGRATGDPPARIDFARRGGSVYNMSPAVAAGRLVILAQSASDDEHLPYPLAVDSSRVEGQGRVLYQFSLPLDRKEMEKK